MSSQTTQNSYIKQTKQYLARLSIATFKDIGFITKCGSEIYINFTFPKKSCEFQNPSKFADILSINKYLSCKWISSTKILNDQSWLLPIALMTSKALDKKRRILSNPNLQALLEKKMIVLTFASLTEMHIFAGPYINKRANIKCHTSKSSFPVSFVENAASQVKKLS